MPRGIKGNTRILKRKLKEAALKREQESYSAPQQVELPLVNPYPKLEPGKVQYAPEYPRVVYEETRSIWSDGSVINTVRSQAKGNL